MFVESAPPAYGGSLVNLLATPDRRADLVAQSHEWPSLDLSVQQMSTLEMLSNGALSPLRGFMTERQHESVRRDGRLPEGTLWTVTVILTVQESLALRLGPDSLLALRDAEGVMLAAVTVEDVWALTQGTHPSVLCVGGSVEAIQLPQRYDFRSLRLSPARVREAFGRRGWSRVLSVHVEEPMSPAGQKLTQHVMKETGTRLLIQALAHGGDLGDPEHFARVRSHRAAIQGYPTDTAMLSLLPFAKNEASRDSVIASAIVAKNFGCTHFLADSAEAVRASGTADLLEKEVGITLIPAPDAIAPKHTVAPATRGFTPQRAAHPSGVTVFFTGLSGSGKSTICNILLVKLLERGDRAATLLDGDVVRKHLSSELGFSKEHREINIRRIGFVASEIVKHGGIAMCAPIAPYAETRREVRSLVEQYGAFVLVHVATSLEVCESRDRKGLYAKARRGLIEHFTGISDPYEPPDDADITIDTASMSAESAADEILSLIVSRGYLDASSDGQEPESPSISATNV